MINIDTVFTKPLPGLSKSFPGLAGLTKFFPGFPHRVLLAPPEPHRILLNKLLERVFKPLPPLPEPPPAPPKTLRDHSNKFLLYRVRSLIQDGSTLDSALTYLARRYHLSPNRVVALREAYRKENEEARWLI